MAQIILTTGANRSIGFAIVQSLALRNPAATYILACRTPFNGIEAISSLRSKGVTAPLEVLELDQTSDTSIFAAVKNLKEKYGHLDILINNAGAASIPKATDLSDFRSAYNFTFDTNVTSVALLTTAFLPLLHASPTGGKVINISSARGSLTRSTTGKLPSTLAVAYSVSKTALNALTIEAQKTEDARVVKRDSDGEGAGSKVLFYAVSPGHCKTAFNGFRGDRDPIVGAEVVCRLALADGEGQYEGGGFWETDLEAGVEGKMVRIPW